MASVIYVNMNTCGRYARVSVSRRGDGDYDVSIESDCENVRRYAERMTRVTEMDIIDPCGSAIHRSEARGILTATCLVPMGVVYAASMEAGMMTKRLGDSVHADEIVLDRCREDDRGRRVACISRFHHQVPGTCM